MNVPTQPAAATVSGPRPPESPYDADPATTPAPIVFVGGTGRSGTHIVARLLGRHSRYAEVPIECRFHVNPRGFPDLLAGRVDREQFLHKLRRFWWYRIKAGEPLPAVLPRLRLGRDVRGLHKIMPRERFDHAVERFDAAYDSDPLTACRVLFLDLLWPLAEEQDRPGLVEMSCFTVAQARTLLRIFPEGKLIHTVRDGRDAGTSKVGKRQKREHPEDAEQGVRWWLGRLTQAERGAQAASGRRVLTLSFDDLVEGDREVSYRSLLDFLEIEDEMAMRELFDAEVNARNAHRGRWRRGLSEAEQRDVATHYERVLDEISASGFETAPMLRRVYERDG
jgi:hypothetical protein